MQDNLSIPIDDYLPLRDVVFKTLRQGILTGELKPGERLMEIHLANRLGVSYLTEPPAELAQYKATINGTISGPTIDDLRSKIAIINAALGS